MTASIPNKQKHLKSKIDHYNELLAIAAQFGGTCVSKEYVASHIKMQFQCIDLHTWEARPNDIKRGTWCPNCRSNKTENLVRQFLETVFKKPFKGASPEWLQQKGQRKRILDGYNEELALAYEYHGEQHFNHIPHFHDRNHKTFEAQQKRDLAVRNKCKKNKIKLIEIKYLEDGYSKVSFIQYIRSEVEKQLQITIPEEVIQEFEKLPFATSKINEMKELALSKGGECLSHKYLGTNTKLEWKCSEGHVWKAIPHTVKAGHWCPYCGGHFRAGNTLEEIKEYAIEKGGKCLSDSYTGIRNKLSFVCKENHSFELGAEKILYNKKWCPYCAGTKILDPLGELQKIAESKGGKLLSTEYVSSLFKLEFSCSSNHTFFMTPLAVRGKTKSWCKMCASLQNVSKTNSHKNKVTKTADPLEELQLVATEYGGKLISNEYVNSTSKLEFVCASGHSFFTTAYSVLGKNKSWCKHCAALKNIEKARKIQAL